MSEDIRVRFAPSPTGLLHIGGARTAIYNWAYAKHFNGTFILRIDDTDPERSTKENTQVILRALKWLGLDWDEGPFKGGPHEPYFQTQRAQTYQDALQELIKRDAVYPCFCSAEKLAQDREAAHERQDSFQGYPGTCRKLSKEEAQAKIDAGEPHVWRIKVPEKEFIEYDDCVHGHAKFNTKEMDDFILIRSDGTPTYNFATVIDDALMGITHIIRGDDHISNTPRQVMVYEALGYPVPKFAHLSMILGPDGKKLSKRHGATSVEEYKEKGYLPEVIVNYLALLGWSLDGETTIFSKETLCNNFDLDRISKNPAIFDEEKLNWMNAEYLKALSDEEYTKRATMPALIEAGLASEDDYKNNPEWFEKLAPLAKPRVKVIPEIAPLLSFLFKEGELEYDEKSVQKNVAKEGVKELLDLATEALSKIDADNFSVEEIDKTLQPIPEAKEVSKKKFFQPIRVGITGSQVSPQLSESMELLGKETCLKRLEDVKKFAL